MDRIPLAAAPGLLRTSLVGAMTLNLPLFFQNQPVDDGNAATGNTITATATSLAELMSLNFTHLTLNTDRPDLAAVIANNFNLTTVLRALAAQFDFVFQKLDGAIDKFLNFELPLVGVRLHDLPAFGFLDDLTSTASSALNGAVAGSFTPASLRTDLENALKNIFPGAAVALQSLNNDVQFHVSLGGTVHDTVAMDADLGFPALGLDVSAGVNVALDWSVAFTLGANLTDGATSKFPPRRNCIWR